MDQESSTNHLDHADEWDINVRGRSAPVTTFAKLQNDTVSKGLRSFAGWLRTTGCPSAIVGGHSLERAQGWESRRCHRT
jgi:hypothetical protein